MNNEHLLWKQLPNEPDYWYARFVKYAGIGRGRRRWPSSLSLVNEERRARFLREGRMAEFSKAKSLPRSWQKGKKKFRWKERRWDYYLYRGRKEEQERERLHIQAFAHAFRGLGMSRAKVRAMYFDFAEEEVAGDEERSLTTRASG